MNVPAVILFLLEKTNSDSFSLEYQVLLFSIDLIALIFTIILTYKITQAWFEQPKDQRVYLRGLHIVSFSIFLRVLIITSNQTIAMLSENQYVIRYTEIYYTFAWIGVIYGSLIILNTNIKIPLSRRSRIKFIQALYVFTIILLFALILISFLPLPNRLSTIIAAFILGLSNFSIISLLIVIFQETKFISSKLSKARLEFISIGILLIALSFLLTPIVILMTIVNLYTPLIKFIYLLITTILSIMTLWSFYSAVFIPKWMKKRQGLVIPDSSLLLED